MTLATVLFEKDKNFLSLEIHNAFHGFMKESFFVQMLCKLPGIQMKFVRGSERAGRE